MFGFNKKNNSELKNKIDRVLKKASAGNLEDRITNIDMNDSLCDTAWGINDLLDQLEAYMRDANTSVEFALMEKVIGRCILLVCKDFLKYQVTI